MQLIQYSTNWYYKVPQYYSILFNANTTVPWHGNWTVMWQMYMQVWFFQTSLTSKPLKWSELRCTFLKDHQMAVQSSFICKDVKVPKHQWTSEKQSTHSIFNSPRSYFHTSITNKCTNSPCQLDYGSRQKNNNNLTCHLIKSCYYS